MTAAALCAWQQSGLLPDQLCLQIVLALPHKANSRFIAPYSGLRKSSQDVRMNGKIFLGGVCVYVYVVSYVHVSISDKPLMMVH